MRFLISILAFLLIALPLSAKDRLQAHGGWALAGYDAVAYFVAGEARPGMPDQALKWRGQIWHFESRANRTAFEANPAAYQPQFDGYSVVSVSKKMLTPGDPQVFAVHENRLYLLQSTFEREEFLRDPAKIIARANEVWRALLGQ
ncbi:YHS domain-containing (seleno)protein [Phaeovulum sp.]|uniref:YHS domain-containing (seleno)protein n=1 Tax=Phaeovulum sp. TaxID=2934796 RepID=UPI0039E59439